MLKVLLIAGNHPEQEHIKEQLEANDCNIESYQWISDEEKRKEEESQGDLEEILRQSTYHFVFSIDYHPLISLACGSCGTKYVSWIYDNTALLAHGKNPGSYINYAFLSDYALYQQLADQGCRSVYYLPLKEPNSTGNYGQYIKFMNTLLFKEGELEIFETMLQLEEVRKSNNNRHWVKEMKDCLRDYSQIKESTVGDIYELMGREERLTHRLKEQLINYLNPLFKAQYMSILSETMVWYKRQFTSELRMFYWEFTCLLIFLNISLEEMHATEEPSYPSMLQYEGIEDICNTYLQTIFYLRRMEYEIEPEKEEEILFYIKQRKLSKIALEHIIREGRIFDKEKVRKQLQELRRRYRNE